jgi:MGT family glycosyltransferase
LQALRAGQGLAPDPGLDMLYRYLHLSCVPPSYQHPGHPLPSTAHALRTVIFDRSGPEELPGWLTDLVAAHPVVYATLGTGFNHTPGIFEAIIAGLRGQPLELIVTLGRDRDPAEFGDQPSNVHLERYIPQSLLFPRCDAVIAHGGWNTALAALAHGLPMVLIPLGADQPYNAERCAALGVARVVPPAELSPDTLRAAVCEVLADQSYRRNAVRLQAEMHALPDTDYAVALLERLARERQPLLAEQRSVA